MCFKKIIDTLLQNEFIRWCIIGVVATVIHYGIYLILQLAINENIAYTMGFVTSFIANFYLTSYFTFKVKPSLKKCFGFGLTHLVNYAMHMGLFNLFLFLGVSKECAPIPVFIIVIPINFMLVKYVFKK